MVEVILRVEGSVAAATLPCRIRLRRGADPRLWLPFPSFQAMVPVGLRDDVQDDAPNR